VVGRTEEQVRRSINAYNITAEKDDSDGISHWSDTKDGAEFYYAALTQEGHALQIWTKEDSDYMPAYKQANTL
jgi:hypothetical protein